MSEPLCPLCGARSTWLYFYGMPYHIKHTIPDDCKFCKAEDGMHWKDWMQGIDVTQFAGKPFNADVEVPGKPVPHYEGVRIA